MNSGFPWITAITALPLLGGLIVIGLEPTRARLARGLSLGISLASLGMVLALTVLFDGSSGALQFQERYNWIQALNVQYFVAIDGLSLVMLLLTAIVVPMALLASRSIRERVPMYHALVLMLQAGLFGTFTALNFFHWFLFWELSLVPAFFLVRLWGGPERVAAATQFFVYTMVGSIALLLTFLALFLATGLFDFIELAKLAREGKIIPALANTIGWYDLTVRKLAVLIFAGAFLGFAVKVPLMPFHSWLPATYTQAPIGTTMLLTGVMSKMGVYGFLRVLLPVFQQEMRWIAPALLWLAVITIVCSAGAAFAQRDLKRLLAYSSINHLGYCLLGIFAVVNVTSGAPGNSVVDKTAALSGVIFQMFNHGLTAATLFWFVGLIEERSNGVRDLNEFGGLRKIAPVFCGLMGISLFSSLGLPGLNGFVGEFLIFRGAFPLATWATALATPGLLITAIFILTLIQKVFWGPLNQRWSSFPDLAASERWMLAPPIALMFLLGIYPQALAGLINQTALAMARFFTW
jgi:NADH-quinone oxidoreductase subunit M